VPSEKRAPNPPISESTPEWNVDFSSGFICSTKLAALSISTPALVYSDFVIKITYQKCAKEERPF